MKRCNTLLFTLLSALSLTTFAQAKLQQIAITAIVDHPALDSIRYGVVDSLAQEGFVEGKNIHIEFQSAQGSSATAAQIARKFVGDKPDVIIPITTSSAQPMVAATRTIPIVFTGVKDPVAAKLVKSWEPSGTNVTGVSGHKPIEPQFELIKTLIPHLKSIGYVYSVGEINSLSALRDLEGVAKKAGIEVVAVGVQRSADIGGATRSLAGKVQVIYVAEDNAVVSAFEALHKAALEIKIPVIASDKDTVKRGALAAYGVNQYQMGIVTGKSVAKVLRGTKAGEIATQGVTPLELSLNQKTAQLFGITFPETLVKQAKDLF